MGRTHRQVGEPISVSPQTAIGGGAESKWVGQQVAPPIGRPCAAMYFANTDWISHSTVYSTRRLRKLGLPGLIASVRGAPDIHSSVGTLPHESAPLLDQMHLKGALVKIDGPPLTPKQLSAAIAYGLHNSCDRDPSFLRT